ncbi:1,4-dihydroxy-2-naphthoate octaprenyltransferase [Neisseria animaloris]|uniref:1,4-dihydroxy-2-naphthoate octaprenyltransferase n=1 Tax=Neisseria animaloris TaxID=326522 RepID=A0A448U9E9_9NEIS|nr:1,4-dihydroxy-2-naphthoate octaprenyltransferase [Neisseria animaloris]VEJ20508.1 1,4-dihydroxy-2-naphthoate octaprenyltransferase [Neisseria animaloris]
MAFKHWLAAARLRTLPLAAASALCGSVSAALNQQSNPPVLVLCVMTAVALQIFSNLANDYGDACNGADSAARRGPERMVGAGHISRTAMKRGLVAAAVICCALGISLLAAALPSIGMSGLQNWLLWLLLGAAAVAAAFAYTAGKNPYGYVGLGDLAVLVFFGWLGVLGCEYLQTGRLNAWSWLPATALGLWCSMVLNINNMRDIDSDSAAGKTTVAVRLGLRRAKLYHTALLAAAGLMWWRWLPRYFSTTSVSRLHAFLLAASLIHLYFLKKAQSCAQLDKLLPQWSITVLLWVLLLWLHV